MNARQVQVSSSLRLHLDISHPGADRILLSLLDLRDPQFVQPRPNQHLDRAKRSPNIVSCHVELDARPQTPMLAFLRLSISGECSGAGQAKAGRCDSKRQRVDRVPFL